MAGMDDYLNDTSYTGDSSEGGGEKMSLKDQGEGFYGRITGNQDKKFGDHDATKAAKKKGAAQGLMGGEKGALGGNGSKITGDGADGARQGENNVTSGAAGAASSFANKVSGRSAGGKGKVQGGFKAKMKKFAPMILAAGGIGGFGAASFFTQMALPFSLMSQLKENFNSIAVSNQVRSKHFYSFQTDVDKRLVKDCRKARIFRPDTFKISKRQEAKFNRAGIKVDRSDPKVTKLQFKAANGEEFTIVPDSKYANGNNTIEITEFYENNQEFRDSYSTGARTWRGAVHAWFDKMASKFLAHFGVKRGIWKRFKKGDLTSDDIALANMRKTVSAEVGTDGTASGKVDEHHTGIEHDIETVDDGNGGTTTIDHGPKVGGEHSDGVTRVDYDLSADDIKHNSAGEIDLKTNTTARVESGDSSKLATKLKNIGDSAIGKVSGIASAIAQGLCGVLTAVSAINLIVLAYQTLQTVKTAAAIFEAIQKGQVEPSETTPIHEMGNSLLMSDIRTYQWNHDGNGDSEKVTHNKNAMESEGINSLYGNYAANYTDPSIQSFNLSNSLGWIASVLGFAGNKDAFKACAYAQLAASIVDAVKDTIDLVLCIVSFGIGCAVDMIIDTAVNIGAEIAKSLIISTVASLVLPFVAEILTRKIATSVMGEDLGNAIVSGANIYMGENHQYSGGAVANKDGFTRYLAVKNEVDADNARVARETLSPFDYTSKYTFAGSLVSSLIPITTQTSSWMSPLVSIGNVFSDAVSSLMPGASAVTAGVTVAEAAEMTKNHCPELDSIGAVGDAFCNPFIITDTRNLDSDPGTIVNYMDEHTNAFENTEGDVPVIKKGSGLANYIKYCSQRSSRFGVADSNIANDFMPGNTGSDVADSAISAVPIVGDLIGALNQAGVITHYGYVSGEACVIDNVKAIDGVYEDWGNHQYYERFIEDQRLAENMGIVEKSSVTAFLEEYYEEHPIDSSFEGQLAARSGMSKQTVIATLDLMDVIAWANDYEPIGYAPYNYEEEKYEYHYEDTEEDYGGKSYMAVLPTPFFEEHRIRNYAI